VVHTSDDPHPRRHAHTRARDDAPRARRTGRRRRPFVAGARASACGSREPRVADFHGRRRRARCGGGRAHVARMRCGCDPSFSSWVLSLCCCVCSILDGFRDSSSSGLSPGTFICLFNVLIRACDRRRSPSEGSRAHGAYIVLFNYARSRAPIEHIASRQPILSCSGSGDLSGMRAATLAML
jgi:hypothetical protein